MPKIKEGFAKIRITDAILEPVKEFKGITTRGEKRLTLDKKAHQDLVHKKFEVATKMDDHTTIFRVKDKPSLAGKEQKEHTVPGPIWTPPSSLGFVMGSLSVGHRVWLATKPTKDRDGFLGDNDEPSILARESAAVVKHGWMARYPQDSETYGCTSRKPKAVFTPPFGSRYVSEEELKSLMDVDADWSNFPVRLDDLIRLTTPLPKKVTDFLKKFGLHTADVNDLLLRMIDKDDLSLVKVRKAPTDIVRELLLDKEVIELLSDRTLGFSELLAIHSEYIEDSNNTIGAFSFKKFHSLITNENSELTQLFSRLGLSIDSIIKLYNEDYSMFCAFADDKTISFFQEYEGEVDIEKMVEIYRENQELFFAMINDEENIIHDTGVEGFINEFEQAQTEIEQAPEDSPSYGLESAYDLVVTKVRNDGCPEGYEQEEDDEGYNSNVNDDEDEADYLEDKFEDLNVSGEDRSEYTETSKDEDTQLIAENSSLYNSDDDY